MVRGKLPPNVKTNPNPNPNQQGAIFLRSNCLVSPNHKTNPNLDRGPNPNRGQIPSGGNCPDTLRNISYNTLDL